MEVLENVLIQNNVDIRKINSMQFITIVMEEVEKNKDLKGSQKKERVISNILSKADNKTTVEHLNTLLSSELISDIIENIIYCAEGAVELNKKIKSTCFCFNFKKK